MLRQDARLSRRDSWALPSLMNFERAGVAASLTIAITACSAAGSGIRALPAPAPEVNVRLREYSIDYDHAVPAGRVVFRVQNDGSILHQVTLLPLPEDVPPIEVQIHGTDRRSIQPLADLHPRPPGTTGAFAADLVAGQRYALVDFLRDADGHSHAFKGMASEFRAAAARPPGT